MHPPHAPCTPKKQTIPHAGQDAVPYLGMTTEINVMRIRTSSGQAHAAGGPAPSGKPELVGPNMPKVYVAKEVEGLFLISSHCTSLVSKVNVSQL